MAIHLPRAFADEEVGGCNAGRALCVGGRNFRSQSAQCKSHGRLTINTGDSLTFANTSNPAQQFLTVPQGAFAGSGTILNNGTFRLSDSGGGGGAALCIGTGADAQTVMLNGTGTLNNLGRAVAGDTLMLLDGTHVNAAGIFRAEGAGAVVDVSGRAVVQGGLLTS